MTETSSPESAIVVGAYARAFTGTVFSYGSPETAGPIDLSNHDHRALVLLLATQSQREVLRARHRVLAAMHNDYSLASPSKRPERTHLFRLAHDEHTPLVTFPEEPWPNDYSVVRGHETLVNLRKIGDLVEGVVDRLRREHADDRLRLHPKLSLVEFETRYGLYFQVDI
ncbi:hypothetical protein ACWEGE_05785 [Amycolatopsis sp. NPDC004747]